MGLFDGLIGGGSQSDPTLRAPGPEEQAGLGQLVRRGEAGTQLSEAQVQALLQLIGPETATQLQALTQLRSLLGGGQFTSPTAEEAIRRQRGITEERVRRQLGPGGEVSTPGIEALGQFGTQSELLREGARGQELQNLLGVLGLLGPQGIQRAQVGFAEPSPGILRGTGVQERLGEFQARSRIAEALIGQQGQMGAAGLAGLGKFAGFGLEKLLPLLLRGGGAGLAGMGSLGAAGMGLSGAGATALLPEVFAAAPFAAAFSDRRLKSNVQRIGTHPFGIGVYKYDLFGRREIGVMADEVLIVRPEAVQVGPDGYLRVNYEALNG